MSGPDAATVGRYLEVAARHAAERDRHGEVSRRLSYARLAVFLGAAALLLSVVPGPVAQPGLRVAAGVAGFAAFLGLVRWHASVEARQQWFATLSRVNEEAAARVRRDWNALPPPADGPGRMHPYADDLDVFGHASLSQLLGWVGTEAGRSTLADWLTRPAAPAEIRDRQAAVAELAPLERAREEFAALGRIVEPARHALDDLYAWAEAGPWFSRRGWVPWAIRSLAAAILGLAGAELTGALSQPWWLIPLAASAVLMAVFGKRTATTFAYVFSRYGLLRRHAELFERIGDASFASARLRRLQADLRESGLSASREMARLATIGQCSELRRVALFHPVVALFTLWDFHVLIELERWQARTAAHLRRWFGALGEFDALAALASLAHDNPSWAFPDVDGSARRIDAGQVGHPLLAADRRVANDVVVGPPGRFLMITGSNMSGKSTLLRAVGVNAVLAQAGAPVCAARMTLPPVSVFTSMRVQDSLEEGVSYFMAALQRLKLVVAAARAVRTGGPTLLYLLDEVLQGTNTAERQVAVRRILSHLLSLPVVGAVTTHDLELADCDELSAACDAVHFSEGVEHHDGGVRLTFDYRLKPGVATSRNALKLLEVVGLDS